MAGKKTTWMGIRDLATLLGVSRCTAWRVVNRWAAHGKVHKLRVGRSVRVERARVEALIAEACETERPLATM